MVCTVTESAAAQGSRVGRRSGARGSAAFLLTWATICAVLWAWAGVLSDVGAASSAARRGGSKDKPASSTSSRGAPIPPASSNAAHSSANRHGGGNGSGRGWHHGRKRKLSLPPLASEGDCGNGDTNCDAAAGDWESQHLEDRRIPYDIEWRLPVGCDFSGFFVEVVLGYVPYLHQRTPVHLLQGRCPDEFLENKLAPKDAAVYRATQVEDYDRTPAQTRLSIAIEHAEPCKIRDYADGGRPLLVISRAMSEGNLAAQQAVCIRKKGVDEVWVPTEFHVEAFARAGVPRGMLRVVPESVDVDFFDPAAPLLLEQRSVLQGSLQREACNVSDSAVGDAVCAAAYCDMCAEDEPVAENDPGASSSVAAVNQSVPLVGEVRSALQMFMQRFGLQQRRRHNPEWGGRSEAPQRKGRGEAPHAAHLRSGGVMSTPKLGGVFRFVSVFKWEQRKGWDVLLGAYWRTFNRADHPDVVLTLRTWKPPWERGPAKIDTWLKSVAAQSFGARSLSDLAKVEVVEEEISRDEMRLLYSISDVFVLPTRGEGWGLPAMEAMSMEVPAIITNYSGPATFVNEENGYPIKVSHVRRNGQAEPDLKDVQRLMKHVYENPQDARQKGIQARKHVLENYHPHMVAETVLQHIEAALFLKYE